MTQQLKRVLSVFSLVMITVTSVDSVRNLPSTALFGSQLIFYFVLAALIFLIPAALVSAELSTMLPEQGGVYVWVKRAFGKHYGFLAIWFQWIENVIWYPTQLSFIAGTLAYIFDPKLANNKYYIISVILVTFWGGTILNLFGMRVSARFSAWCGIFGLFIPMILIILLGVIWILGGHPLQISLDPHSLLPNFSQTGVWVAFTGIMLSFSGIEIATVYAGEVRDPKRDYPKALLIATIILLATLVLGSLSIAIVIPKNEISLVAGLMEAFYNFFTAYHLQMFIPLLALMIIFGGIGSISNWIIAPSKGLLIAANDGNLPARLAKANQYGAPTTILISQACITTLITLVFLLMPAVSGSYWYLTALAAQLYMFMYILMFAAGIVLRLREPKLARPYAIAGGKYGMWIVASLGIFSCVITLIIGFFPPDGINVGSTSHYVMWLALGLIVMSLPPFLISWLVKKPALAASKIISNNT
jgi:amino acid transporter